jgi:hypothetical protein
MWRKVLFLVVAASLLALGPVALSRADKAPPKASELMKKKLMHSQKVLEGIALSDFNLISKHGEELLLISQAAEWRVLKTTDYQMFSNSFQRSTGDLIKQSKAKNLDAAALAYVELTLTCVKCHKHVRDEREISFEEPIR